MAVNLEYGLYKDGRMLHITKVKNGLECDCVCPNPLCGERLIAKNNIQNKIDAHFAHKSGIQCEGAKESELHQRSKQIICDNNQITLPDGSIFKYQLGSKEKKVDKYRADVKLEGGDYLLFVEVVVTSAVSLEKEYYLKQSGNKTLVINLEMVSRDIKEEDLKVILIDGVEEKSLIKPDLQFDSTKSVDNSIFGIIIAVILAGLYFIPKIIKSRRKKNRNWSSNRRFV